MNTSARDQFRLLSLCAMLIFAISGCSDTTEEVEKIISETYGVVYELSITGQSSVSELNYEVGHGALVNVQNPPDGWRVEFPASKGEEIAADLTGIVHNGGILLTVTAAVSGRQDIVRSDSCNELSDTPTACSLDIAPETLP